MPSELNLTLHVLNGCLPDVLDCETAPFGSRVTVECAAQIPPTRRGYLALYREGVFQARTVTASGALRLTHEYAVPLVPLVGIENIKCDFMENDRMSKHTQIPVRYGCTPSGVHFYL